MGLETHPRDGVKSAATLKEHAKEVGCTWEFHGDPTRGRYTVYEPVEPPQGALFYGLARPLEVVAQCCIYCKNPLPPELCIVVPTA